MRDLVKTIADDQIGIDAKLPRTLKALFLKPGFLTSEFMNGRIARYLPPFRLYLIASVLFFVLVSFLSRRSDWAERQGRVLERQRVAAGDSAAADTVPRQLNFGLSVGKRRVQDVGVSSRWEWLDRKLERNLNELNKLPPNLALRRITDAIIEELPKVMFVLLPVFALLLKLFYVRRRRYYVEHFVFALHVHAFAFVLFALMLVFRYDAVAALVALALAFYLFAAMKRVYQQGYIKTALKWAMLSCSYAVLLVIGLAFVLLWALASAPAA